MKKQSAKERIAEKKKLEAEKRESFRQKEIRRQEEIENNRISAEKARQEAEHNRELSQIEKDNPDFAKNSKSRAKAAGLKSVLVLNEDKLLVTSFGKGNKACPDKYVEGGQIYNASDSVMLSLRHGNPGFKVSGRIVKDAPVDNPLLSSREVGMDQIRCKSALERRYFGQEFTDNIHIQLIYNILDIEKILSVHVNNIVLELNNLLREEGEEHFDLIGYLGDKPYEKFKNRTSSKGKEVYELFHKLICQKQMGYFGNTFVMPSSKKKGATEEEKETFEKKCYYLLVLLGIIRQATAHGDEDNISKIYRFDETTKGLSEVGAELNSLYEEKINALNKSFFETSGKDMFILCNIYSAGSEKEKSDLANEFYSFAVLKSYKNLGFSIKRVRENLQIVCPNLKDKKYDTVRRKLNKLLDFIIWKYYLDDSDYLLNLVDDLRATTKESEKELIYRNEASALWKRIGTTVKSKLIPFMDGNVISSLDYENINEAMVGDIKITSSATSFSKMIFFITIFIDGKEINDLLTQLISNFDNIAGFIEIAKAEGLTTEFVPKFSILEKSAQISKELRLINSFSKMSKETPKARKAMFMDAAELLGYDDGIEVDKYLDEMLKGNEVAGPNKGFRNFIINNVIESDRFKYLVRYGNPKKLRKIANNKAIVDFVLKEIPDNQIKFYYNSCNGVECEYNSQMRTDLANKISTIDFSDFAKVQKGNIKNPKEAEEKERKKNIVRLYLTVLYLLVKNLVYVNSRYYLAFHCQERDSILYDNGKYGSNDFDTDRRQFAIDFVNANSKNIRAKKYITLNYNNSDKWAVRTFRNCAEHMNAVRNMDKYINEIGNFSSYFEIYHYLVQRVLIDQFEFDCSHVSKNDSSRMIMSEAEANPKLLHYFQLVKKHNSYCKDFVKALNIPFAYNLARYKNLSINELFDRNNYLPSAKTTMENQDE